MSQKIMKAAAAGDLSALQALLEAGADLSATVKGRTPLIEAVIAEQSSVIARLLAHGVALDVCDATMGWTALGWAASANQSAQVVRLLAAGADIERQSDDWQRTPLMAAAQGGATESVAVLLQAGANVAAHDELGCTAADLARANGHAQLAQQLDALLPPHLQAGAPVQVAQLPWPDEPISPLSWPADFPAVAGATNDVAMGTDVSGFDAHFHAALAPRLAAAFASPTAALRSWVWAMHHWEKNAGQAVAQLGAQEDRASALMAWLAGATAIRHAFATPRVRKYPWGSVSTLKPQLPLGMRLTRMETVSANKAVISTQYVQNDAESTATRGSYLLAMREATEFSFTLVRKAGQWRIDSWKARSAAGGSWGNRIV